MKLPPSIVAKGWIDLQSLNPGSEGYLDGSWAFEVVLDAIDRDPTYAWEVLQEILIADDQGQWDENIALGILSELLCDHLEFSLSKISNEAERNSALLRIVGTLRECDIGSVPYARLQQIT